MTPEQWVARARGPLGRWRLSRAGDRGDRAATNAAWELWLDEPDPELWAALTRWRRPHTRGGLSLVALGEKTPAATVIDAVLRAGHPIADLARTRILAGQQELVDAVCAAALSTEDDHLVGLCVEHHLAPADSRQAAMFFLLTGQSEQYRLVDPDHSLLTLAYRAAEKDERARIRGMVAGEADLVRVLADSIRRDRMAQLTWLETRYLVDAFVERQDWPALWELAKDLPVVDAVDAVHRVDGWRPDGPDATLFDVLAAAAPDEVAESRDAVAKPWRVRVPVRGAVTRGSISPDRWTIAVATRNSVDVFTISGDAGPEQLTRRPALGQCAVLALDDGGLVFSGRHRQAARRWYDVPEDGYLEVSGGAWPFHRTSMAALVVALAPIARGFAALAVDRRGYLTLHRQRDDGELPVVDVGAKFGIADKLIDRRWAMATAPSGGLIAFAGDGLHLAKLTSDLRELATVPFSAGAGPCLAFYGPDRLIGVDAKRVLRVWRVDGDELTEVAKRQLGQVAAPACPVGLPAAGAIAVIDAAAAASDATGRRVRYLDAETLADAPTPKQLGDDPSCLFVSPDGAWLGVGGDGYVTMTDGGDVAAMAELAERPLAATSPADLHAVHARLAREPANPFFEVLYACLVDRFAMDVALGGTEPVGARGDDIALGGSV